MKLFNKCLAIAVAGLMAFPLFTACSAQPVAEEPEKKTYTGSYEEIVNAFYEDHKDKTAGAMVGIFDKDGTLFEGYYGYSDIANGIKVDENTVIDWGSTTKTMVWVSVMQLWEQGKIDLEKDVREYLPDGFLTNLKFDKKIRMIDLMNHRAGFQEYYTDMMLRPDQPFVSLEEALKYDQPEQVFEPDTMTAYSNWGVALAGYIVERISGESFADYVHEHIFEPLGMKDSALAPDLMDNPGVRQRRDKLVCYRGGTVPYGTEFYYIQLYPAGACVSTLKDFMAFASCFVKDKFPLFEKQETFEEMMKATSYYGDTDVVRNAHGLWALPYGSNTYGHGGNTQCCSSYITFDPEKQIGCVVMTNQGGETFYNGELFESIYGKNEWESRAGKDVKHGLYHAARTVLKGHFRIMGVGYVTDDTYSEWFWTYNEKDGICKIEIPYGDVYYVSTADALPEIIVFYCWMISVVFAGVSLIVKGIRAIVRKIMKSKKKIALGALTGFAALNELAIGAVGLVVFALVTGWYHHSLYLWTFPALCVLTAILAVLTVTMLVQFVKTFKGSSVIRKIYNILAILFAVTNVVFFIIMEFWH